MSIIQINQNSSFSSNENHRLILSFKILEDQKIIVVIKNKKTNGKSG